MITTPSNANNVISQLLDETVEKLQAAPDLVLMGKSAFIKYLNALAPEQRVFKSGKYEKLGYQPLSYQTADVILASRWSPGFEENDKAAWHHSGTPAAVITAMSDVFPMGDADIVFLRTDASEPLLARVTIGSAN